MKIRRAIEKDLEKLNWLLRASKAYWGYDEIYLASFMQEMAMTPWYLERYGCWIGHDKQKFIGFYGFGQEIQRGSVSWELDYFFIDPECVGKGYGRKLWKAALQTAKELGVASFKVWGDVHAKGFYEKMGATLIGEEVSSLQGGVLLPIYKVVL